MAPSDATPPEPRAQIPHPRQEQPPTAAAQVALFVEQAAELRRLRTELERSRRRECNAACDEVGYERDRLAGELENARVGLVTLGERVKGWRDLATQHGDDGMRAYAAWKSARRRSRARTDERDAWKALYEAQEDPSVAKDTAALEAQRDLLGVTLEQVLRQFVHKTYPGTPCLQSNHVGIATVEKWRAALNQPMVTVPDDDGPAAGANATGAPQGALAGRSSVQDRCPACHRESLFLGDGGYITCQCLECTNPEAATNLLERDPTANPEA